LYIPSLRAERINPKKKKNKTKATWKMELLSVAEAVVYPGARPFTDYYF